jgi:membrane associated rhomboid family serine protease
VLPIKDKLPQDRLPIVTIALIAVTIVSYFVLEHGGITDGPPGGILLALANAVLLWLFGPNVEDSMGRLRFIAFVVVGAGAATIGASLVDPPSSVPAFAASAAVVVVLGGYLVLFPRGRILSVVLVPFMAGVVEVPALILLGLGLAAELAVAVGEEGVDWLALVGGFALGLVLVQTFVDPKRDKRGLPPRIPAYR